MFGTIWGNDTISRKSKTVLTIDWHRPMWPIRVKVMLAIGVIVFRLNAHRYPGSQHDERLYRSTKMPTTGQKSNQILWVSL